MAQAPLMARCQQGKTCLAELQSPRRLQRESASVRGAPSDRRLRASGTPSCDAKDMPSQPKVALPTDEAIDGLLRSGKRCRLCRSLLTEPMEARPRSGTDFPRHRHTAADMTFPQIRPLPFSTALWGRISLRTRSVPLSSHSQAPGCVDNSSSNDHSLGAFGTQTAPRPQCPIAMLVTHMPSQPPHAGAI